MIGISSHVRMPALLSPRTASYVAALIRQGDNFDYSKWLQEVNEEERGAKQDLAASTTAELVRRELGNRNGTPEFRDICTSSGPVPKARKASIPIAIWRSYHHKTGDETPESRLRRRLEKIRSAWSDFQSSRARDAVYGYLACVFAIVEHYKARRKTEKFLRQASKFVGLPFDKNADPFTTVIRCTCDPSVDSKTISKWARALRYIAHCQMSPTKVKAVMKEAGGVNACADRYARYYGRGNR